MRQFLIICLILVSTSIFATCSDEHLKEMVAQDVRETFQTGNFIYGDLIQISESTSADHSIYSEYRIMIDISFNNFNQKIVYAIETTENSSGSCIITYISPVSASSSPTNFL